MKTEFIDLIAPAPGMTAQVQVLRFGQPGMRKAYIQAALHADEVPAMLVAHALKDLLLEAEAAGRLQGEIVLVPFANPLGLAQNVQGQHHGRFSLHDGQNFNRGFAELSATIAQQVQLTDDAQANVQTIRTALAAAAFALPATTPLQDLKRRLLQQAISADIVLDLHCDNDAVMHVYALTPQSATATQLGAQLGAQAVLLATESGDNPFDEACSRPWLDLQQQFGAEKVPLACFASTIELRGEKDTSHSLAAHDAQALANFLILQGLMHADSGLGALEEKQALCAATPLSGSEPITAPHAGVVVFHRQPGERVQAGDVIADLVNPQNGEVMPVRCQSSGLLYARTSTRWAHAGKRLAKVAGTELMRTGKLLSY
jgi:uncharacterized protein